VHEGELLTRQARDLERIRIGQAHAAVQRIQRHRQVDPLCEQTIERLRIHGVRKPSSLGDQVELLRGLQRVAHVEVVRAGLCPVFPGMSGRIAADETLVNGFGGGTCVVPLQRFAVVCAFVTEQPAKALVEARAFDQ